MWVRTISSAADVWLRWRHIINLIGRKVRLLLDRLAARLVWSKLMKFEEPRLQDTVHTVHSTVPPKTDRTLLSPYDVFEARYPLDFFVFYAVAPQIEALKKSLSMLLVRMPQLGGQLRVVGRCVYVVHSSPVAQLIEVADKLPSAPNDPVELPSHVRSYVRVAVPVLEDVPLFQCRLTPVAGGGALLSLCISHGLVDVKSWGGVVAEWAALCRANSGQPLPQELPSCRENLVSKARAFEDGPEARRRLHAQGWTTKSYAFQQLPGAFRNRGIPIVPRRFRFDPPHIVGLKKLVTRGTAGPTFEARGLRLSTHDVVTAALCKVLAESHPQAGTPDVRWSVLNVLNWRDRTSRVAGNYFGNATTHPNLTEEQAPRLTDVIEGDLSEMALMVRLLNSSYSEQQVEELCEFMSYVQYESPGGLAEMINVTAPKPMQKGLGLWVSNFCKFDELCGADFGTGVPETFFGIPPRVVNIAWFFPVIRSPGSVEVSISVMEGCAESIDQRMETLLSRALSAP